MRYSFKAVMAVVATVLLGGCLTVHLPEVRIQHLEEAKPLTWHGLVQEALQMNPDLKKARYEITSSARSRDIAAGDYLPSVDGTMDRDVSRSTASGDMGQPRDNLGLGIVANQSLFNGFDTTGQWIKSRKDLDAMRLTYVTESAGVRFRLRTAYVDLMRLERLLDVNQQIAERRKQNAEMVRLRYEAGRENVGSAMRAEAISAQASFDVKTVRRHIESQSLRLAREAGSEFVLPIRIGDSMEKRITEVSATEPDYAGIAEKTPQVQRLIKVAESFKASILSSQSALWPQVDGTWDYGYAGSKASNLRDQHFLGLAVSVPFFNGGKNIEGIRKAKADYQAAQEAAVSTRDEVIAQLAGAWVNYVDAIESVEYRKLFLEASRKRAEIVRAEYANGLVSFQDFDIAEQENADSEKAYVESLANVFNQQASWELIQGATLEEAIHEI